MKILAINSSPRSERQSKTALMLDHLVQGMRDAGAEVKVANLRSKKIQNCIGCFTCWTKTPGICIHKDDMTSDLYPKWVKSDLVVYASPLYHFTLNASMKAFIERTLPHVQPFFEERGGRTVHPPRIPHPKVVMLSVAGLAEKKVFEQLSVWAQFIFGSSNSLVAEIYRPLAEALPLPFYKDKREDILDATAQAGREIVESLMVTPETMARITQPIADDIQTFRTMGNLMWKTCIAEGITPIEFDQRGIMPRPDSIETFMIILPMGFNAEAADDMEAVIQFSFSGDIEGTCHFRIENGGISAHKGESENPSITIKTPFDLWMDIMTKKADGQEMFAKQKFKISGNLLLLLRIKALFGGE
jgi:putative NADPH-quinone reductase